ncbi:MAG: gliding motility lipoprotein GldH [Bacteroides sp.]|nr:gliding motility lipoprotein GldH [Bacteroides sp.]
MIIRRILGTVFFIILLSACDSEMVYDHYTSFDSGIWKWNDVAVFEMDVTDTLALNNIYLQVRHSTDYPMSNLYMFVNVKGPGGQFRKDTVNLILATPEGQWIGRGTGSIRELRLLYKSQTRFGSPGVYNFSLEQAMRKAELPVTDVGVRIERIRPE